MSCGHQGKYFGANYEDGICIDGYMWDLDSCDEPGGGLSVGGDFPCPMCNEEEFLNASLENVEEKGAIAADDGEKRECPITKENLRRPEHFDVLVKAWYSSYDAEIENSKPA